MAGEKAKEVKPMRPGGPRGARGPMPKIENPGLLFKRLFSYVFTNYKLHYRLVVAIIICNS